MGHGRSLLWTDTASIGLLVAGSDLWPIPLIMLLWSFGVTFGSVAMGAAVMSLHAAPDPPRAMASERLASALAPGSASCASPTLRTTSRASGGPTP